MAAIGFGRRSYVVLAWLFVAGTVVQVYFAGLGLLVDPTQLRLHVSLGNILHSIVLLQLVLAFTARLPRPIAGLTVLQNVLFFAQYAFIHAHGGGKSNAAMRYSTSTVYPRAWGRELIRVARLAPRQRPRAAYPWPPSCPGGR